MFVTKKFPLDYNGFRNITEFVSEILEKYKISKKDKTKAILIIDEATDSLIRDGKENTEIIVKLTSFLGSIHIELLAYGEEYSLARIYLHLLSILMMIIMTTHMMTFKTSFLNLSHIISYTSTGMAEILSR